MPDLTIGQRLALPYESDDTSISVAAEITGLGLPAVRVRTEDGETYIRHARKVTKWTNDRSHD